MIEASICELAKQILKIHKELTDFRFVLFMYISYMPISHVSFRDKLYISMHNNDMNKLTLRIIDTIKKIVVDVL